MPGFTFKVSEFRPLRTLDWSPRGVCVLSGANGAGKTSTLGAMKLERACCGLCLRACSGVPLCREGEHAFDAQPLRDHFALATDRTIRGRQGAEIQIYHDK